MRRGEQSIVASIVGGGTGGDGAAVDALSRCGYALAMRRSHLDAFAIGTLVLLCLTWGLNQVAAKLALPTFPPFVQVGLRSAGACALILGWCAITGRGALAKRDGTLPWGLLAGLFFAVEFSLIFVGLQWTEASRTAVFLYTAPFFVALGARWLLPEERFGGAQWLGLVLSFCGVAVALGVPHSVPSRLAFLGDVMVLLAGVLWAATTLLIKASPLRLATPEKVLIYQLAVSAAAALAASFLAGERLGPMTTLATGSLAFQTVWVAGITYLVWFWLLSRYPASPLQAGTSMTPLFGILGAFLVLDEPISLSFAASAALVVAGLVLVNGRQRASGG
jgi:drug/metabolite transporter (DMT)-like permease